MEHNYDQYQSNPEEMEALSSLLMKVELNSQWQQ